MKRSQGIQWLLNDTEEPWDSSTTLSFFRLCLFNCYASFLLCVFESQDPVNSFRLGLLEVSMCLLRSVSVSLVAAEVWLQLVRISSPGKCWTFPEFPLSATYSLPPSVLPGMTPPFLLRRGFPRMCTPWNPRCDLFVIVSYPSSLEWQSLPFVSLCFLLCRTSLIRLKMIHFFICFFMK